MLSAQERCDGKECGAQAYVFAEIGQSGIQFCGHHGTKYWGRLNEVADRIYDFRYLISEASKLNRDMVEDGD